MAQLKPIHNSIFVLPDKAEDKQGMIYLSDYSKKRPTSGTIIAVAETVKDFKVGQRVLYGELAGVAREMTEDQGEIYIMQPSDILALLE